MVPFRILGIPIIEEAAPGDFVAQTEREIYSQVQLAIDALRCPLCGSLNYEITLLVFSTGVEKLLECHNCGGMHEEMLSDRAAGLLAFLPEIIVQGSMSEV
jgi:hypothetical protein